MYNSPLSPGDQGAILPEPLTLLGLRVPRNPVSSCHTRLAGASSLHATRGKQDNICRGFPWFPGHRKDAAHGSHCPCRCDTPSGTLTPNLIAMATEVCGTRDRQTCEV